jgi:hypothetical protein
VDLSGNALDDSDLEVIRRAVASNTTLTSLDVRGNSGVAVGSAHLAALVAAVRANEVRARDAVAAGGQAPLTGVYAGVIGSSGGGP